MKRNKWTEKTVAMLKELYPVETNAHTADIIGMSLTAVKTMARKLGLSKEPAEENKEWTQHVLEHFHDRSYSEMGKDLGVTKTTIHRIAGRLGLKRTKEENASVNSRVRTEMIRRERRRAVFGLDSITKIKVVTNRPRILLRARMKARGYIVGEERNILYYAATLKRRIQMEAKGIRLGLQFIPLEEREDTILSTAI